MRICLAGMLAKGQNGGSDSGGDLPGGVAESGL